MSVTLGPTIQQSANPPVKEPVPVSETVVDGVIGVQLTNGSVRLTAFVDRINPETASAERVLVARWAMTPEAARIISESITKVLDALTAQGAIPTKS